MQFRNHTLNNGLQIVAECNDQAYSTALGFFVETGARDETPEIAGVSHFLEHMAFKGTPTRSADDVNREFDEMGAHANAYTNEESTVFHASILPEFQGQTVDLLADLMRPSLREDDFETEKQVIVEEIMMYDDMPPFGADDRCRAMHYNRHPLANSVLGTAATVGAMTADAMREYFDRRYSPANITLVGAGKVDFDRLVQTAEQLCGRWTPVDAPRQLTRPVTSPKFQVEHRDDVAQEYVIEIADGPDATEEARYASKLLAVILGDDTGSRLYWELIDPGLAEHFSLGHYEYDDAGMYYTTMSCEPEQAMDNMRKIHEAYCRVHQDGVTQRELDQAKSKVCSRIVLASERPRGRLFAVGGDWMQRNEYRSIRDDLEIVRDMTTDDIRRVLDLYDLTTCSTIAIGPATNIVRPV